MTSGREIQNRGLFAGLVNATLTPALPPEARYLLPPWVKERWVRTSSELEIEPSNIALLQKNRVSSTDTKAGSNEAKEIDISTYYQLSRFDYEYLRDRIGARFTRDFEGVLLDCDSTVLLYGSSEHSRELLNCTVLHVAKDLGVDLVSFGPEDFEDLHWELDRQRAALSNEESSKKAPHTIFEGNSISGLDNLPAFRSPDVSSKDSKNKRNDLGRSKYIFPALLDALSQKKMAGKENDPNNSNNAVGETPCIVHIRDATSFVEGFEFDMVELHRYVKERRQDGREIVLL